jgi:hypothetical protein
MRKPSAGAVLQERAVLSAYFHRLFLNEFSRGFAKKGKKRVTVGENMFAQAFFLFSDPNLKLQTILLCTGKLHFIGKG